MRVLPAIAGAGAGLAVANLLADRWTRRRHAAPPSATEIIGGETVRLLDAGEGEPVLLVHGNGAMIEDMVLSGLVGQMAPRRRVLCPDRPGYGTSGIPDGRPWSVKRHAAALAELIRRRLDRAPVVIGHSLGALAALRLALDTPHLVRGLVLVSGYYVERPQAMITAQKPLTWPVVGPAAIASIGPEMAAASLPLVWSKLFAPNPVPPWIERFPADILLSRSHLQSTADGAARIERDARAVQPLLDRLDIPVHLFAGDGDSIIEGPLHAHRLAKRVSRAQVTIFPGTGHMAHHIHPRAISEAALGMA